MSEGSGLSERERRYLLQCLLNAHHTRDHETLERIARQLLSLIPQPVPKEDTPCDTP